MEVNTKDYQVLRQLGKGKGGYSYLVSDGIMEYVLKQIHHEPCSYYSFGDKLASELNDYSRLKSIGICIPRLLAVDKQRERILKEFIPGPTAYEMVLCGAMTEALREKARAMSVKAYSHGLNLDYFPTNFIIDNDSVYYIDYECNSYMDEWSFDSWGVKFWSQTPELEAYVKEHAVGSGTIVGV